MIIIEVTLFSCTLKSLSPFRSDYSISVCIVFILAANYLQFSYWMTQACSRIRWLALRGLLFWNFFVQYLNDNSIGDQTYSALVLQMCHGDIDCLLRHFFGITTGKENLLYDQLTLRRRKKPIFLMPIQLSIEVIQFGYARVLVSPQTHKPWSWFISHFSPNKHDIDFRDPSNKNTSDLFQ